MHNGIDRVADGWSISSMRGTGIGEVVIGRALRLHVGAHGIELHRPAELTTDHGTVAVHASARTNLDHLPHLLDQVVAESRAADAGSLHLRFANGWRLDAPVSCDASGWIVALPGNRFIGSRPGGGLRLPPDLPQA